MTVLNLAANASIAASATPASAPLPAVVTLTGTINGGTLTASSVTGNLANGQVLTGASLISGTQIENVLTANAVATINQGQTVGAEAMTAMLPTWNVCRFINDGSVECFIKLGGSAVSAGTTDVPILATGTLDLLMTSGKPYVSVVTATGTTTLRMLQGGALAV